MIISKDNRRFITIEDTLHAQKNLYSLDNDVGRLGAGGNAAVYECQDRQGNIWAIKFLINVSEKSQKRFSQEVKLLLKLNHPHIIKCVDYGETNGILGKNEKPITVPFLIMEKADMNIVDYMRNINEYISYDIYAPQIRGLAEALSNLHKIAIHRDIKPENILVRGETWLLSDFGLCSALDEEERLDVTRTNERVAPKYWLSPEAADRPYFGIPEIDMTSDVYQLSAVFWFIITKRYPLGGIDADDYSMFDNLVCDELIKALKYNKEKRIQNGGALYESICNVTINREA